MFRRFFEEGLVQSFCLIASGALAGWPALIDPVSNTA